MPTGYTHGVQEGKITSLRVYALTCARAFGALIMLREESSDAPIPEKFEPDTQYHDDALTITNAALAEIPALSADECDKRSAAEFEAALKSHTDRQIEKGRQKDRYEEMLGRVSKWEVPADLDGLKDFMASQLRQSIDFDCSGSYRPDVPIRLTGEQWREKALSAASHDMAYHTVKRQEEIDRVEGRNKWLAQLRAALPKD